jgi:CPA1 family monovalent cation:H+ antiporter
VAALALGGGGRLPARLVTLIEGEGLLNDATALTTLTVAVTAVTSGRFSFGEAVGHFLLAAVGGLLAGVAVAFAIRGLRRAITDPLLVNALSLATPFAAYLLGEAAHVSGVLAVAVAGLMIGHDTPRFTSGASRLQTSAVWRLADFLLQGFVFLLIGQQIVPVLHGLHAYSPGTIITAVAVSLAATVLLRPVWLVVMTASLRAVPARLVGQGLTFGLVTRLLGVRADPADEASLRWEARAAAVRAGLARLDQLAASAEIGGPALATLRVSLEHGEGLYRRQSPLAADDDAALQARREVIDAQREELLRWRDAGHLPDASLRVLQRELDHEERTLPPHGDH